MDFIVESQSNFLLKQAFSLICCCERSSSGTWWWSWIENLPASSLGLCYLRSWLVVALWIVCLKPSTPRHYRVLQSKVGNLFFSILSSGRDSQSSLVVLAWLFECSKFGHRCGDVKYSNHLFFIFGSQTLSISTFEHRHDGWLKLRRYFWPHELGGIGTECTKNVGLRGAGTW